MIPWREQKINERQTERRKERKKKYKDKNAFVVLACLEMNIVAAKFSAKLFLQVGEQIAWR